ncbi:MAG TPA: SsrA-binding protein SmpB [Candidatus Moranbacteria bacterium]|nr:SsrA-binding protein SmpB [Candidatus Moranbacteria bacterium]
MATIATNRRASFDYDLRERYEAGIILSGGEVKSVKTGHISLSGSFVTVKGGELYLTNADIPRYKFASQQVAHDPTRSRKLLLHKAEIKSLIGKAKTLGLTLVPVRVYTKGRRIKLEFALAKGKKSFDKRQSIARREADRKIGRALRS